MKKILLLVLFISFCSPAMLFSQNPESTSQVKTKNFLTDYRLNPFQWIYPEYFYKAEIIPVENEKLPPQGFSKVEFFGLAAYVPSEYTNEIIRKHNIMGFKSKTGNKIVIVKSSDDFGLCSEEETIREKDYCSAFKTHQEYIHKLFTLTPDTAETIGDKWMVHCKGMFFDDTKKIEIYSGDKFIAYVKFIKDSMVKERKFSHEITLFHANGPLNSYITISFIANDDTILKNFLSTIE
jgi:hypothetical protein